MKDEKERGGAASDGPASSDGGVVIGETVEGSATGLESESSRD